MATTENQDKAGLPKGDPDVVRDQIAGHPASFSAIVSGSGDEADPSALRGAFILFVDAARVAGFNVGGALAGSRPAYHDADGELVAEDTWHFPAADVPQGEWAETTEAEAAT